MLESVEISVGGKTVITSGSVILPIDHTAAKITLRDLVLELRFVTREKAEAAVNTTLAEDGKSSVVEFTNFNSALGTGFVTEAGTVDDKPLYIAFYISALTKDGPRLINYTFYLGISATQEEGHE